MNHAQLLIQMNRYRAANRAWDVKHRLWQEACASCKALAGGASDATRTAAEVRRAELHRELVAVERAKDIAANFVALALFDILQVDVNDCGPSDESLDKILKASLRVSQL
jgi:hypothetical protein